MASALSSLGSDGHRGLTSAEAAARTAARGPRPHDTGSRSVRAIVRANLFTLVNAITLVFLVLIAVSGAWNDAVFAAVIAFEIWFFFYSGSPIDGRSGR